MRNRKFLFFKQKIRGPLGFATGIFLGYFLVQAAALLRKNYLWTFFYGS